MITYPFNFIFLGDDLTMNKKKICSAMTAAVCFSSVLVAMPQLTAPTYAASVVSNNFEETYEGWHGTTDEFQIEAINGAGFENSRGMAVTGRTTPADGAASSKGLWLEGGINYTYNLKVFAETNETFHLTLLYKDLDTEEETTVELINKDVKAGEWTDLSTSFKAPENTYEYLLTLTTDSTNDFWFDDVLITQQKKFGTAQAAPSGKGLKDEFAKYFRVGNIFNRGTISNSTIQAIILKDHNAIECENETKPSDTIVASGSTDTNVKVSLNNCAAIADFAQKNGLGFRGHTFVWHSQTPSWFFKQGFNNSGATVSTSVMDQRMESYIKNMFAAYKTQYPSLDLYAYDVCNEIIDDGTASQGGVRSNSPWVQVYGNNSFVEKAFTYARKYAPSTCKLYYNDYNEFADAKQNCIINTILKPLKEKKLIDGMGMQSHLNCAASGAWGDTQSYLKAMDKYLNLGLDVQVTELDLAREGNAYSEQQQADKYSAIFKHCMDWNINHPEGPNVTLVQVWGPTDNNSWVRYKDNNTSIPNYPLLYNENYQAKAAYTAVTKLVNDNDWGTGLPYTGPGSNGYVYTPPKPIEPDENGYYFRHTFEDGSNDWTGRGAASVAQSSKAKQQGSNSLYCSGRTATWNGAEYLLPSNAFKAGTAYSFSVYAMTNEGGSTSNFKLTLQYDDADGKADYKEIASGEASKGEWIQLANKSYTLPAGGSNFSIYVEITDEDSLIDFYIDDAIGAVDGTVIGNGTTPRPTETASSSANPTGLPSNVLLGDANCDKQINIADAVLVMQVATNPDKYGVGKTSSSISELGAINGDVDGAKGLTNSDALLIQKYKLGLQAEFVSPYAGEITKTTSKVVTQQTTTKTVTTGSYSGDFMKTIQLQSNAPQGFDQKGSADYGTMEKVTYYSKAANGNKKMNVILPPGYNKNEKYPVLYALHGIGGTEDSMPGMGVQTMLGNAIAQNLCPKMIIVCPDMLTGPGQRMGFDQQSMRSYDKVREDIIESIMPYMEEHYSIKTGRDNTAITGFSLGGREALYTGVTKSEYFGYIGGACPAPGIFPTTDRFMTHEGSLKNESDFVPSTKPYMLLISSAGESDGVVTGYPEAYDKALTSNNVQHLFQTIPNAGHDNSTVTPHFYNFLKYVFKAA